MKSNTIKIALPGEDAMTIPNTAENIKKFSLLAQTPDFTLLKVKTSVKVTIADSATETIAHGLAYTPIVWVFMKNGSDNLVPVYDDTSSTYMYVDATNLVIRNKDGASRDFYYYIFYDAI
jgi:hypothetical protein